VLGSLPLMILKHDSPLDARFIRACSTCNYKAVMVAAGRARWRTPWRSAR
jgi:hypothetical protein